MSLPEKSLFSIDEIIARWHFIGCDRRTLLDYATRDLIVFSVYLRDLGHYQIIEETEDTRTTTTHTVAFSLTDARRTWKPVRYLKADDARRILEATPGERIGVSVLYSSSSREKANGVLFSQAKFFTADDLFVTKKERDRIEAKYKIRIVSGWRGVAWRWLRDPANQSLVKMVGAALGTIVGGTWVWFAWLRS